MRRLLPFAATVVLAGCAHTTPGSEAYRLADVDEPPAVISCPEIAPVVPADFRNPQYITVRFGVDAEGRVVNPEVRFATNGEQQRAKEAIDEVRSCRYQPAMKDGVPVEVAGMAARFTTGWRDGHMLNASRVR